MRPPGLVGDPKAARSDKPGSARRGLGALRALLVALIGPLIASAALFGAAAPALAGQ
ncbi:MAG TPA: hypothetical protein VE673_03665 [Pseudonocardiaceae bacterium]|nr:hypothetical protein [Pseudonocardiaceae bacterium]